MAARERDRDRDNTNWLLWGGLALALLLIILALPILNQEGGPLDGPETTPGEEEELAEEEQQPGEANVTANDTATEGQGGEQQTEPGQPVA